MKMDTARPVGVEFSAPETLPVSDYATNQPSQSPARYVVLEQSFHRKSRRQERQEAWRKVLQGAGAVVLLLSMMAALWFIFAVLPPLWFGH